MSAKRWLAACFGTISLLGAELSVARPAGALGIIAVFHIPSQGAAPVGITAGPDGNLWFAESGASKIGRITTQGAITEFPLAPQRDPAGITQGPDGNLWFTEAAGNAVGRITPTGVVSEFPLPIQNSWPIGITSGPDGNLWFAEFGFSQSDGNRIGRITPAGTLTEFPIPTPGSGPNWITVGPDGNLWFTEGDAGQIGRVTTQGQITEFPVPVAQPLAITTGPDGNLWFTGSPDWIWRITPEGRPVRSRYVGGGNGIIMGPDGYVWFGGGNALVRIVPGLENTFFTSTQASVFGLTGGPDGNVWFTDSSQDDIGVVTTSPEPALTLTPDSGSPGIQVHVSGVGFASKERVDLVFFGPQNRRTSLGHVTSSQSGGFQADVTIPLSRTGTGRISATGDSSDLRTFAPFVVT